MQNSFVPRLRSASRDLVRELGFMSRTVAGTSLSPSGVHALIEIDSAGQLVAKDLAEKLLLEKSTVSRLVGALVADGEIEERRSASDGRSKDLILTEKGRETLGAINEFAVGQVQGALNLLESEAQARVVTGIENYAGALRARRRGGDSEQPLPPIEIRTGYCPRLLSRLLELHAITYGNLVSAGPAFEAKTAREVGEFATRLDSPANGIWYAEADDIVGTIAIDGEEGGDRGGHLRWFVVDSACRGAGIGRQLLKRALAFCDEQGLQETALWTFKGLDAARCLYEKFGFRLVEEHPGRRWGSPVLEQKFVRAHPATGVA